MIPKIIVLFLIINVSNCLIAFDCSPEESQFSVVSLVTEPNCKPKIKDITESDSFIQVLQTRKFDKIPYLQCLVVYDVLATRCSGWFSESLVVARYSHVVNVGRDRCKEMHQHRVYRDLQFPSMIILLEKNEGEFNGYVVGSVSDKKCAGGTFYAHKRNLGILEDVAVHIQISIKINVGTGSLDLKENQLILNSNYQFEFAALEGFEPVNGNTYWERLVSNSYDCVKNPVFSVYQGRAKKIIEKLSENRTRITYIVKNIGEERDFLIESTGKTTVCGIGAFNTPSVNLFITESLNGQFPGDFKTEIDFKNVNTNLLASMKIAHLSYDIGMQMSELYRNLQFEKCLSDSRVILNMLALAKVDPVDWGYLFFKRPGYVGTVRSEVIYLQQCSPTNVSHRATEECFNELPVTYQGRNMFITPRSRLLVEVGTQIPCSNIMHNMHFINNNWYIRSKGVLIPGNKPSEVSLLPATEWEYKPLSNLDSGFYSKEQLEGLNKVVFAPLTQSAEVVNYINTLTGINNSTSVEPLRAFRTMDFITLKDAMQTSIWDFIKNTATSIGDATSLLIGLFLLFKVLKFISNTIINAFVISYAFGFFNFRMLFACWSHLVNLFLHHEQSRQRSNPEIDLPEVITQQPATPIVDPSNKRDAPAYPSLPDSSVFQQHD